MATCTWRMCVSCVCLCLCVTLQLFQPSHTAGATWHQYKQQHPLRGVGLQTNQSAGLVAQVQLLEYLYPSSGSYGTEVKMESNGDHTHIHTYTHTHRKTCLHLKFYRLTRGTHYSHTYTHIHTHTHTHIHTHRFARN